MALVFLLGQNTAFAFFSKCKQKIDKNGGSTIIAETDKFRFRSNIWVNLHHYLYEQARKGPRDYEQLSQEKKIFTEIPASELKLITEAVLYYANNITQHHLIFTDSLYKFKCWLAEQDQSKPLSGNNYSGIYLQLNKTYDVYKKHIWGLHRQLNDDALKKIVTIIDTIEETVFSKLEKLSNEKWPTSKINVDVTCYAGWAGAYTSSDPITVTQSFFDSRGTGLYAVETVFHESSHLIYGSRYWLGKQLAVEASSQNKKIDRNFWHAVLFYITGKVVQEKLKKQNIHFDEIYMVKNDVFARFLSVEFCNILDQYIGGDIGGEFALRLLIQNYGE